MHWPDLTRITTHKKQMDEHEQKASATALATHRTHGATFHHALMTLTRIL